MAREDDYHIDILLVGYENQENLGLRSILAYLSEQGYEATLAPFAPGRNDDILEAVRRCKPRVVGFSLIFQYTLDEMGELMRHLRANAIGCHFTVGGHYPSLRPEDTLELLPELDSVVRFEGELTIVELLDNLEQTNQWEKIQGIAFRNGSKVVLTPLRPLISDLDMLPHVYRDRPRLVGYNVRLASMLASRGCLFNCSFCSIRQFYGGAGGPLRRARHPEAVVQEMKELYTEHGIELFIFQDDDFAARTGQQRQWLKTFLRSLSSEGLSDKIKWKISCRVDDLEPEILECMIEHGLTAVYLGVESGSEQGLRTMNKRVSVAQNLAAVNLLKSYDLAMGIGFMLFDPSSSVESIRDNIDFLRTVGNDGYFPINFCKLLPYAGTRIESQLVAAGRLKGTQSWPDYNFLDARIDSYAFLVQRIFSKRNFSPNGIVMRMQNADFDHRVGKALGMKTVMEGYDSTLRHIIAKSNKQAVTTLEVLLENVLEHEIEMSVDGQANVLDCAEKEWRCEAEIEVKLTALERITQTTLE